MGILDSIFKSMAARRTAVFRGTLTPDEINKTLFGTGDAAVVGGIPYDTENNRPGVATIGGNLLEVRNGDVIINVGVDFFEIHSHEDIPEPPKTPNKKEDTMERKRYDEQLRNAGPQCITDEVMHEMVEQASTSTGAIRQRIQRKRELAEKCTRYYPVMQRCKGFSQQVAAAATIKGAVTIKDMMGRRNRTEEYFIGPPTIVFSDELAALEFEPTALEKAEMENEASIAAAKMNQSPRIDPEKMKRSWKHSRKSEAIMGELKAVSFMTHFNGDYDAFYPKAETDKIIEGLRQKIAKLEAYPRTDNSTVIATLIEKNKDLEEELEKKTEEIAKKGATIRAVECDNRDLRLRVIQLRRALCHLRIAFARRFGGAKSGEKVIHYWKHRCKMAPYWGSKTYNDIPQTQE